jgi:hypothetical protein
MEWRQIHLKTTKRIMSFALAVIMMISFAMPVSAQEIKPLSEITDVTGGLPPDAGEVATQGNQTDAASNDEVETATPAIDSFEESTDTVEADAEADAEDSGEKADTESVGAEETELEEDSEAQHACGA